MASTITRPASKTFAVYTAVSKLAIKFLPAAGWLVRRLVRPAHQRLPFRGRLIGSVPARAQAARSRDKAQLWGRAIDGAGNRVSATLETPGGYALTVLTALEIVKRIRAGGVPAGFLTPAKAFGSQLICGFPGVSVEWTSEEQPHRRRSERALSPLPARVRERIDYRFWGRRVITWDVPVSYCW